MKFRIVTIPYDEKNSKVRIGPDIYKVIFRINHFYFLWRC